MKIIRKVLLLSVLLVFGACIAMETIQEAKENLLELKKQFLEKKKKFQDDIDEIDKKLETETNEIKRKHLRAVRKTNIDLLLPSLDSCEAHIKTQEDHIKFLEQQTERREQAKQEQAKIQEQARKAQENIERQQNLIKQQAARRQAEFLNKKKRVEETSLFVIPILCICISCIYALYKNYTAKKEDPVDDENINLEEDLQEEFFVEENTEY